MKKLFFTIFLITIPIFASQSYEEKLISLRTVVPVEFAPTIAYFEKHTGVDHLYDLAFKNSYLSNHFGHDKIIRKVIISNKVPKYSVELYDNTLLFDHTGRQSDAIVKSVSRFLSEISGINSMEYDLSRFMNKLSFYRPLQIGLTTTNRSFLQNLKSLATAARSSNARYRIFDNIQQVIIKDTPSPSERTTMSKKLVNNDTYLHITFARSGVNNASNYVNDKLIRHLLDIIAVYGFHSVKYSNISEVEVTGAVSAFWTALSDRNVVQELKALGIKHFILKKGFKDFYLSNSNKTLTLGITTSEIRSAISKLNR